MKIDRSVSIGNKALIVGCVVFAVEGISSLVGRPWSETDRDRFMIIAAFAIIGWALSDIQKTLERQNSDIVEANLELRKEFKTLMYWLRR